MSIIEVSCPKCGADVKFSPEKGIACKVCFYELNPSQYVYKMLEKMGFTLGHENFGDTDIHGMGGVHLGKIDIDRSRTSDDYACKIHTSSIKEVEDIIELIKSLRLQLTILLNTIEPRPDLCPVCNRTLKYKYFSHYGYSVGCSDNQHTFLYKNLPTWLGSNLAKQYPKHKFTVYEDVLIIYQTTLLRAKWLSKAKNEDREIGTIKFVSHDGSLAIWITKAINESMPGLLSYINSLSIKGVKAVLVND